MVLNPRKSAASEKHSHIKKNRIASKSAKIQNSKGVYNSGQIQFIIMAIVLFIALVLSGGIFSAKRSSITPPNEFAQQNNIPVDDNSTTSSSSANKPLQLRTLKFTSPSPTPTSQAGVCGVDNGSMAANTGQEINLDSTCHCNAWFIECHQGHGSCIDSPKATKSCSLISLYNTNYVSLYGSLENDWCHIPSLTGSGDGIYCLDKPIVYLYPTQPTLVNVFVDTPAAIVKSDPLYPSHGWKNILAHPDGTLLYQEKQYSELFYESALSHVAKPQNGMTIPPKELKPTLQNILTQIGLNNKESTEFLEYWLPRLNETKAPYIYFSFIEPQEKERIDKLVISPEPDTRIEFLAYFKPVHHELPNTLQLPETPPQRKGFTEVEWGGTLDLN
jgi:hypothetical protein